MAGNSYVPNSFIKWGDLNLWSGISSIKNVLTGSQIKNFFENGTVRSTGPWDSNPLYEIGKID